MNRVAEILEELRNAADESTKRTLLRHGATEPVFGVKVQELKKIQKRLKRDHDLALELYATGNSDAMYLASLICEPAQMTKADLQRWVKAARWSMLEGAVAWAAAESRFGWELGLQWIKSPKEKIAATGWATLSSLVAIKPDSELDIDELRRLLLSVAHSIEQAAGPVAYAMNGFVIAVGSYVAELTETAKAVSRQIGQVSVDMGDTACKVPNALEYIDKVAALGRIGKKRKTAYC